MTPLIAALAAAACWLGVPPVSRPAPGPPTAVAPSVGRRRPYWWAPPSGALGAWAFLGGAPGLVGAVAVLVVLTIVVVRAEDPGVRRDRLAVEAQLPHLVLLLAAALRAGAPVGGALRLALEALPGPAAQRLAPVLARLSLGVDPAEAWEPLRHDPAVAPLARAMVTSTRSGARVADAAERLADDLAAEGRARAESRARTVGVRAAVPLGLCLLPSFLLIGIVPVVAGLVGSILR